MAPSEDDDRRAGERPVVLFDETEDGFGAGDPDTELGETGDAILGEAGETVWTGDDDGGPGLGPPRGALAADRVPLAAEEAAVHVVDAGERDEA